MINFYFPFPKCIKRNSIEIKKANLSSRYDKEVLFEILEDREIFFHDIIKWA
jgi:hypothetical protein